MGADAGSRARPLRAAEARGECGRNESRLRGQREPGWTVVGMGEYLDLVTETLSESDLVALVDRELGRHPGMCDQLEIRDGGITTHLATGNDVYFTFEQMVALYWFIKRPNDAKPFSAYTAGYAWDWETNKGRTIYHCPHCHVHFHLGEHDTPENEELADALQSNYTAW